MWCRLLLLMSLFAARRGALAQRGCRRESKVVIGAAAAAIAVASTAALAAAAGSAAASRAALAAAVAGSAAASTAALAAVAAIAVASTADGGDVFQRLLRHVAWHVASDGGMAGAHP